MRACSSAITPCRGGEQTGERACTGVVAGEAQRCRLENGNGAGRKQRKEERSAAILLENIPSASEVDRSSTKLEPIVGVAGTTDVDGELGSWLKLAGSNLSLAGRSCMDFFRTPRPVSIFHYAYAMGDVAFV